MRFVRIKHASGHGLLRSVSFGAVLVLSVASNLKAQSCAQNMLLLSHAGDYVAIPSSPATQFVGPFSLECWAEVSGASSGSALIQKATDDGQISYSLSIDSNSRLVFAIQTGSGIQTAHSQPINALSNWHHYAAVYSPSDSIRLYVDSTEVASVPVPAALPVPRSDSLRIGMNVVPTRGSFPGAMDEVRLWNRALSQSEILSHLFSTLSLPSSGLVAYYSFDDDPSIPVIHDFAGGHDGALIGASSIVPSSAPIAGTEPGFRIRSVEKIVQFPTLYCTYTADTIVHLYNPTNYTIAVGNLGFANGKAFSVSGPGGSNLLPDSGSVGSIGIHVNVPQYGTYVDTLIILSSSVCGGSVRIPVKVIDSVALFEAIGGVNFGTLTSCHLPATKTLTLRNAGNLSTHVTGYQLSDPFDFSVVSPSFPLELKADSSVVITMQLNAGPFGSSVGSVEFFTDECLQNASASLTGVRTGIALSIPPSVQLPTRQATLTSVLLDTEITIQNTGTTTIDLASVTIAGKGFKILNGPTKYALAPGDSSFVTVEFSSAGCGSFTGLLQVHVSQPCVFDSTIPIELSIQEPTLSVNDSAVAFGSTCSESDSTIVITNTSPQSVLVTGVSFSPQNAFQLKKGSLPDTLGPGASKLITLAFTPEREGLFACQANILMLPCGGATVALSGSTGIQNVSVSDTLLGFGRGCQDITPFTRSVTITNHNSSTVTIGSTRLVGSPNYKLQNLPLPNHLLPGGSLLFTILYSPTGPLPERDDALLTILSSDSCLVDAIHLTGSREGGTHQFTTNPFLNANFGVTCPGTSDTLTVAIYNSAIDTIDVTSVTVTDSAHFTILPYLLHAPAGDSVYVSLVFHPDSSTLYSGRLGIGIGPCGDSAAVFIQGSGGPVPQLVLLDSIVNFGSIEAGDSATRCVNIVNPSCASLTVSATDILLPAEFSLANSSVFPMTLLRDIPQQLCIQYQPKGIDSSSVIATFSSAISGAAIQLYGISLAPEITLLDTTLDFGYVILNASSSLSSRIENLGNDTAYVSIGSPLGHEYSTTLSDTLAQSGMVFPVNVTFNPTQLGVANDTLIVNSRNFLGRIILRGIGAEAGLTSSAVELDFGNILVGNSALDSVAFSATNGFPISLGQPTNIPPFSTQLSSLSVNPIKAIGDTSTLVVQFQPMQEGIFRDTIFVPNTSHPLSLIVTGRGVLPHVEVSPADTLDFGKVQINGSLTKTLAIMDTGLYQLLIQPLASDSGDFAALPQTSVTVLPASQTSFGITFSPTVAGVTHSLLHIKTSSPDSVKPVVLTGRGTYGPGSEPDLAFGIANESLVAGDRVSIPVTIAPLAPITVDSMRIDVRFDPYAVYIHGVITDLTLTSGLVSTLDRNNDSTVSVRISGGPKTYTNGIAFMLDAEALLTSHDTTNITLLESNPDNTLTPASEYQGIFIVGSCSNQPVSLAIASATSIGNPNPNPVTNSATFSYQLGAPGRTTLSLFDPLGRNAKTIVDVDQTAGLHVTTADLSALPSGHYEYVLRTPTATRRGVLIIEH